MSRERTLAEWWAIFGGYATASVIPHNGQSRTIPKALRGKVPGTLNRKTGLWSGTFGAVVGRFMTLAEAQRADEDGATKGIYGDIYLALDIDVEIAALADAIQELAIKMLGPAPVRGREGSVRRSMMYAPGARIRKITGALVPVAEVVDADDKAPTKQSAVELLGSGQYWNCDGLHPSGKRYFWDTHPCDLGPFDITVVTNDMLDAFYAALAELVQTFGFTLAIRGAPKARGVSSAAPTSLDDPSFHCPAGPDGVIELLGGYRPEILRHDDFVLHMRAIKAALGPSREDYYPQILEWAPGVRSQEGEATWKVWASITDTTVGWGWLVDKTASPAAAQADFAAPPDDKAMPKGPDTVALEGMFDRYAYWRAADRFVDLVSAELMKPKAFNAANRLTVRFGKGGEKTAEAKFINGNGRVVDMATYRPGQPRLITENYEGGEVKAVNLYKPSILKLPLKIIRPDHWLGHLEMAFPDPWAFKHFLQWHAFLFQRPGERIGHAPVSISKQGIGKDTLIWPVMQGLGEHNVEFIRSEQLINPQFTPYLKHQLIICDELMNNERPTAYNTIKTLIANPRDWRTVNEKFIPPYKIPNNQNYEFFGNRMNAITMEEDDRRLWCYEIIAMKPSEAEFKKLRAALDAGETAQAVLWMKHEVDLADFQRFDAPMTPSKRAMMKETRPVFVNWLHEQFAEGGQFHGRMYITTQEIKTAHGEEWSGAPVPDHQITSTLRYLDFVNIEGPHRDGETLVRSIWTRDRKPEILNSKGQLLVARLKADQKRG